MICLLPNCCFLSETSRMLEIYRALRERGDSRDSARRLQQIFAAVDGPAAAAQAVLEIAAAREPGPPSAQRQPADRDMNQKEQGGPLWTTSRC